MRVHPGESRLMGFMRIIFASMLFGCIVGLLGGWTIIIVRELLSYRFSN